MAGSVSPLDSHIRVIRAIQFASQDLEPLLPEKKQKVPGTTINACGALLQDCAPAGNPPDYCIFSSWVPAIVGGVLYEGPSAGTLEGHMLAAVRYLRLFFFNSESL